MTHKPLTFSLLCIFIASAISAYAWFNLPDLEQYPVHWNAQGEPDGFGSRKVVGINLVMFPMMSVLMTALFYLMPKIEPLRQNLEDSRRAYHTVWMLTLGFLIIVGAFIAWAYMSPDEAKMRTSPRVVVIGISLLFIGVGNVMGKVRQNFMFGIRTPWTLSSELSWEKTHRLGARGFVAAGFASGLTAIILPRQAFLIMMLSVLAVVLFSLVYSYRVWKSDPNKRV